VVRVALFKAKDRRGYEKDLHAREERALRQLTDEQETARLREQFIAVLGHDLRNPLASIAGVSRLLSREVQSQKAHKVLQLLDASVDRMVALIDDVMDFARGRLGRGIVIDPHPTLVEPILQQLAAELEAAHPGRTIRCDLETPTPVSIDPVRIGQMVSNLLANALTYGAPNTPVQLQAKADASHLAISVANAGAPIPEAVRERLFQPFFRGEVKSNQRGLGLGLHIAHEIAKAHGGDITVRSDHHETRFSFVMPTTSPTTASS
jgi:sigma-B regulation protein RsbU (phosphoserine phosphatase)